MQTISIHRVKKLYRIRSLSLTPEFTGAGMPV